MLNKKAQELEKEIALNLQRAITHQYCPTHKKWYHKDFKVCPFCDHVYAEWLDAQFEAKGSNL